MKEKLAIFKQRQIQFTIFSGILIIIGAFLAHHHQSTAIFCYLLAFIIGGYFQAIEGIQDICFNRHLNVDVLMMIAAIGASIIGHWLEGALLIFIFSLSGALEEFAINKSQTAITELLTMQPQTANRYTEGNIEEVTIQELQIGDHVLIRKGEAVPIDGKIIDGTSLFDESMISGEAIPAQKTIDDQIYAGTINTAQPCIIVVTKRSDETIFSNIVRLVEEAKQQPTKTATFINKIEDYYVKAVLLLVPACMLFFYFGLGWTGEEAFYRGMVLLTVASPCALVASATPAVLASLSNGAKRGILFKSGPYIEQFSQLEAIVFDKTGTLTEGNPSVIDCATVLDHSVEFHTVIHAMEKTSTHPLAKAIVQYTADKQLSTDLSLENFDEQIGYGLTATHQGSTWKIGKLEWMDQPLTADHPLYAQIRQHQKKGNTLLLVQKEHEIIGYYALFDTLKSDSKEIIRYFHQQGIHTIMMTGDSKQNAQIISQELQLKEYYADCLPEDKAELILKLKKQYSFVTMVGDGINDAPALANATLGIAIGQGTAIAIEVSDVVLMKNKLSLLQYGHQLSQKMKRIITQNIFFSLSVICLLIAANVLQLITLPLGVIGHEGSTILVILNGLRLLKKL